MTIIKITPPGGATGADLRPDPADPRSLLITIPDMPAAPPAPPVAAGINALQPDLAAAVMAFPGMRQSRLHRPAGLPPWRHVEMGRLLAAGVTPWVSFTDWYGDDPVLAAVGSWLTLMPTQLDHVYLTYRGDQVHPGVYRSRWVLLADAVRAHRNGDRVTLVPTHALRGAAPAADHGYRRGCWQVRHPLMPDGSYAGDLMGWDCHVDIDAGDYPPPVEFFRIPVGAAYQAGVPLAIAELGAPLLAGDTGPRRAVWIADCITHLRDAEARVVNWWHPPDAAGLADAPSIAAWKDAIRAQ